MRTEDMDVVIRGGGGAESVAIALVGKYTDLSDAYLSVLKALQHAAMHLRLPLRIVWIESTELEQSNQEVLIESTEIFWLCPFLQHYRSHLTVSQVWKKLKACQGILVPGGFGDRGIEGVFIVPKLPQQESWRKERNETTRRKM
jgi:CTP synthase